MTAGTAILTTYSTDFELRKSRREPPQKHISRTTPLLARTLLLFVGRSFLKIMDEKFPKNHALHKIFNRNTVKISCSCIPDRLKQKIDGHNKSILRKTNVPSRTCNCRLPAHCPMDGNCLSHPWFTRQQLQQRTAGQPKLT